MEQLIKPTLGTGRKMILEVNIVHFINRRLFMRLAHYAKHITILFLFPYTALLLDEVLGVTDIRCMSAIGAVAIPAALIRASHAGA